MDVELVIAPLAPLVVVIAGPNGAGKTTSAPRILRGALAVGEFVNADPIAHGLSALHPETVAVAAGRVMLARVRALAAQRASFAFETTLASRHFAPWLQALQAQGYRVHLAFLSLPTVEMAVARVAARVRNGGHNVPEDVVRRRYRTGLTNFFTLYQPVANSWQMFDNSEIAGPRLVCSRNQGAEPSILDEAAWQRIQEAP